MMRTSYDDAQYVAAHHECPDCRADGRLVVKRDAAAKRDIAVCGRCGRREGFVRRESLTARWRRDPDSVPIEMANKLERKYGGIQPMSEQSIAKADEQAIVQRIEQARWLKELTPQDRTSLAHLSVKYGLDPLMKELTLYEGAPYIAVAGLIRIAHRQKEFAGLEDRPMTEEERKAYGYKAPFCWLVKVYRTDWKCAATGTGTADPANPFRNNPIERTRPEWMARSRAIRQALKLSFPHSMPFDEAGAAEERGIDPETGEIVERDKPAVRVLDGGEGAEWVTEPEPESPTLPGELTADDIPADDTTPVVIEDERGKLEEEARRKLDGLVKKAKWSPELWATKFRHRYQCTMAEATLDQLNDAIAVIEVALLPKAKAG